MVNGEYNLVQVSANVKYTGNDEGLIGNYPLVIWENKTAPILEGREEDGMSKVFADVATHRNYNGHWFVRTSSTLLPAAACCPLPFRLPMPFL